MPHTYQPAAARADFAESFEGFFSRRAPMAAAPAARPVPAEAFADDPEWASLETAGIGYRDAARMMLSGFEALDDEAVDSALADITGRMTEDEAESFWSSLARGAASLVQPVAGVIGTAVGGPLGGALATTLGGFASQGLNRLASGGSRPQQPRPQYRRRYRPRAPAGYGQFGQQAMRMASTGFSQLGRTLGQPGIQRALTNVAAGLGGQIVNAAGQALSHEDVVAGLREQVYALAEMLDSLPEAEGAAAPEDFAAWADAL